MKRITLEEMLEYIQSIDEISIQDSEGVRYNGIRANFEAETEGWHLLEKREVDVVRAYKGVIIILLK